MFGDKKLGDSKCRLVIPSYNLGQDCVQLFKTPHHERLKSDWCIPAWKVALATSAAPTYFPTCTHIESMRLIDGGVWANNPTVVGIAEAVSMLGVSLDNIHVLSLGTTDARVKRRGALDRGGLIPWIRKSDVVDVIMRGQSVGTNGLATHLIGPDHLIRIDPIVPEAFALDRLGRCHHRYVNDVRAWLGRAWCRQQAEWIVEEYVNNPEMTLKARAVAASRRRRKGERDVGGDAR